MRQHNGQTKLIMEEDALNVSQRLAQTMPHKMKQVADHHQVVTTKTQEVTRLMQAKLLELRTIKERHEATLQQKQALELKQTQLETELQQQKDDNGYMSLENDKLRQELGNLRAQHGNSQQEVSKLKSELAQFSQSLEETKLKHEEGQKELEQVKSIEAVIESKDTEIGDLKKANEVFKSELAQLKADREQDAQKHKFELESLRSKAQEQVKQAKEALGASEKELSDLQARYKSEQEKKAADLEKLRRERDQLEKEAKRDKDQLKQCEDKIKKSKTRIDDLEKETDDFRREITKLNSKKRAPSLPNAGAYDKALQDLQKSLSELQTMKEAVQKEHQLAAIERQEAAGHASAELQKLKQQYSLDAYAAKPQTDTKEIDELRHEMRFYKGRYESLLADHDTRVRRAIELQLKEQAYVFAIPTRSDDS